MMRTLLFLFMFTSLLCAEKNRLIVTTDIGGDPDDSQSMVRLLVYANEFDVEGLITSASGTPGELGKAVIRPDLVKECIQAYAQIVQNLQKHADGYPSADALLKVVKEGNPYRGLTHIGENHDTEASEWIIHVVDKPDPRPVNIAIWGGQTDLCQALWKIKNTRSPQAYHLFQSKIRVYDIADQDNMFFWIQENAPDLFYILNKAPVNADKRKAVFRGMYLDGDISQTSTTWLEENIAQGHGPLGALYPTSGLWTAPNPHGALKEGDTPSWFYFYENGLNDPDHPEFGGWGGRFEKTEFGYFNDAIDTWNGLNNARTTVCRWRPDFMNDFAARMDWCVSDYNEANHNPTVLVNGEASAVIKIKTKPGKKVKLSAAQSTDPDGDELAYEWLEYPEAGSYAFSGEPKMLTGKKIRYSVPEDLDGHTIHLVLRVTDNGSPHLSSYKRIILY